MIIFCTFSKILSFGPGSTTIQFLSSDNLEAIEESKKPGCDCTPEAMSTIYYWLSRVYASKNPVNPIHDEEKAKYWENKYEKFTQKLEESDEESSQSSD